MLISFYMEIHGNFWRFYVYVYLCAFAFEPLCISMHAFSHVTIYGIQLVGVLVNCHPLRGQTRRWRRQR